MGIFTLNNLFFFVLVFVGWSFYRKHDEKTGVGAYRYTSRKPDIASTIIAYALFVIVTCSTVMIVSHIAKQFDPGNAIIPLFISAIVTLFVIAAAFIGTAKIGRVTPTASKKNQDMLGSGKNQQFLDGGESQSIEKQ